MNDTTVGDRILFILTNLCHGRQTEFAQKTGIQRAIVNKLIKNSPDVLFTPYYMNKIVTAFPQVSLDWLATGKGYSGDISIDQVKAHYSAIIREKDEMIRILTKEIDIQQRILQK